MSKKTFAAAPKPQPPSDDAIAAFEQGGLGHDQKPEAKPVSAPEPEKVEEVPKPAPKELKKKTQRLSLDIEADLHRRFKIACLLNDTTMLDELTPLIEKRVKELEKQGRG